MSADTARTPFDPRVIGAVVVIGVIGFIAMWALMALGPQLSAGNNAQGHALSKGVAGYAGIVDFAERAGMAVDVRREVEDAGLGGEPTLLVLTPDQGSEADEIAALIKAHDRDPVLIILPKWQSIAHPQRKGWTGIAFPVTARKDMLDKAGIGGIGKPRIAPLTAPVQTNFTQPGNRRAAVTLAAGNWQRMVPGPRNSSLLAMPGSDEALLVRSANRRLYVLTDPDLVNNFAFASRERARTALSILDLVAEDSDATGIAFDVTLNGLGGGSGFLRLAFVPPFIGITACLIAAGLFVLWQAAARFGPARVPARAIPISKRALIESSAELVAQTRREADGADAWLRGQREALARALHAPPGLEGAALDDWIDRRRPAQDGREGFAALARRLPLARNSNELLGLARALHGIRKDLLREH